MTTRLEAMSDSPQIDLAPVHRDADVSERLAAAKIAPVRPGLLHLVLTYLEQHPEGVIPDQVCAAYETVYDAYSLRPRFAELARMGKIRKTAELRENRRGNPERVWVAS